MISKLFSDKTRDSFWLTVEQLLQIPDCFAFTDYDLANDEYSVFADSVGGAPEPSDDFVRSCTPAFWESFDKFVRSQQRRVGVNETTKRRSIELTVSAQRAISKYCHENKCDHCAAIVAVFSSGCAPAPVLSVSDQTIANEVVRALYEKIGKRLARIEETMFIVDGQDGTL